MRARWYIFKNRPCGTWMLKDRFYEIRDLEFTTWRGAVNALLVFAYPLRGFPRLH